MQGLRNGMCQVKVNEISRKRRAGKINGSREYRRELFGGEGEFAEELDVNWEKVSPLSILIRNFQTYKEIRVCGQLQEIYSVLVRNIEERL